MTMRPEQYYSPPSPEYLNQFVRRDVVPPLDPQQLEIQLFVGEERSVLHTTTTGDMSLVLAYKNREGYLASLMEGDGELTIVQLQGGASRKSYRVASGLHVVRLFSSQIEQIATHPESPYRELSMPAASQIDGIVDAQSESAAGRYNGLAAELGMRYSREENRFVRKLK